MSEQSLDQKLSHSETEETLYLISEISNTPSITQRELSSRLNISLGKTNYLINQLVKKGLLKAQSFSRNPGKLKKLSYMLTQKGLEEKIRLTYYFLKVKEMEYLRIKQNWLALQKDKKQ